MTIDMIHADPARISGDFVAIVPRITHANAVYAERLRDWLLAKATFEKVEAKLAIEHREAMILDEKKKVTEAAVQNAVITDKRYAVARLDLIDTEADKAMARGVLDSLMAAKDMLISLGAHLRAELDGDPSMRRESAGRRRAHDEYEGQ